MLRRWCWWQLSTDLHFGSPRKWRAADTLVLPSYVNAIEGLSVSSVASLPSTSFTTQSGQRLGFCHCKDDINQFKDRNLNKSVNWASYIRWSIFSQYFWMDGVGLDLLSQWTHSMLSNGVDCIDTDFHVFLYHVSSLTTFWIQLSSRFSLSLHVHRTSNAILDWIVDDQWGSFAGPWARARK